MNLLKKTTALSIAGLLAFVSLALLASPGGAGVAEAQAAPSFTANLGALNDSGATGTATVSVDGRSATVQVQVSGLAPGAPHAQHFHIGGQGQCPTMALDADGDGLISTVEGVPAYGSVKVSLTTSGDVSPGSALAIDRFPTGDTVNYSRTFDLPEDVSAQDLANASVIVHGIDLNGNGQYDGDAPSSLDPGLPLEATIPASCGPLDAATAMSPPSTGDAGLADAGGDGTSLLLFGGIAALLGAGVIAGLFAAPALTRRR